MVAQACRGTSEEEEEEEEWGGGWKTTVGSLLHRPPSVCVALCDTRTQKVCHMSHATCHMSHHSSSVTSWPVCAATAFSVVLLLGVVFLSQANSLKPQSRALMIPKFGFI